VAETQDTSAEPEPETDTTPGEPVASTVDEAEAPSAPDADR